MAKLVSAEDFVIAWATASDLEEVARTTGMKKSAVQARAYSYRKLGVRLPKLAPPKQLDQFRVSQLNSLIEKHDIRKGRKG